MVESDNPWTLFEQCSPEEQKAIEEHKWLLSERAKRDVGFEYAVRDWMENHSARWRRNRLRQELEEQRQEMLRHKWIESERAGRDLGDKAIRDWVEKYAEAWRRSHK